MILDEFGIVTRGLSTASNTDQWHYNKRIIGASKCFQAGFIYNEDCLEAMKEIPDKYFDLAIVDPPYGISITDSGRLGKYNKKQQQVG